MLKTGTCMCAWASICLCPYVPLIKAQSITACMLTVSSCYPCCLPTCHCSVQAGLISPFYCLVVCEVTPGPPDNLAVSQLASCLYSQLTEKETKQWQTDDCPYCQEMVIWTLARSTCLLINDHDWYVCFFYWCKIILGVHSNPEHMNNWYARLHRCWNVLLVTLWLAGAAWTFCHFLFCKTAPCCAPPSLYNPYLPASYRLWCACCLFLAALHHPDLAAFQGSILIWALASSPWTLGHSRSLLLDTLTLFDASWDASH